MDMDAAAAPAGDAVVASTAALNNEADEQPPRANASVNAGSTVWRKRKSGASVDIERPGDGAGQTASKWRWPWQGQARDNRAGKSRTLYYNTPAPPGLPPRYPTNGISTTKYSIITFLPKNLFEQFRRVANAYFVLMFILQTIPIVQAWPVTVSFVPIMIVLGVSAIKDALEDINRFRSDLQQNQQTCTVLREGDWKAVRWSDVTVGDFVRLTKNEVVPADMVIIASFEDEGLCFIETKNLDGETNLKVKRGIKALETYRHHQDVAALKMTIEVDQPVGDLYRFAGSLTHEDTYNGGAATTHALTIDNLLPRGCVLRNCKFIIGAVVCTGSDTKVMLNAGRTPSKRTKIEKVMNEQILFIFIIQALFAAGFTIGTYYWRLRAERELPQYFDAAFQPVDNRLLSFTNFWTLLVISQNLIPIALYASFEFVKLFQAYFINEDADMYNESMDQRCVPRSWNLSDELGQIEYIFTDKTGTLTSNVMRFNQCSINGFVFGRDLPTMDAPREHMSPIAAPPRLTERRQSFSRTLFRRYSNTSGPNEDEEQMLKRHVTSEAVVESWQAMLQSLREYLGTDTFKYSQPTFDFCDSNLLRSLILTAAKLGRPVLKKNDMIEQYNHDDPSFAESTNMFFLVMALCHSTVAEYPGKDDDDVRNASFAGLGRGVIDDTKIMYNAQSPDEAALVRAAANMGYVFLGRVRSTISLMVFGALEEYQLLNEIAFTSDRKRMSVIVKAPDGRLLLLCKGADNVIYERLSASNSPHVYTSTQQHISRFSSEGLRTLCLSYRVLRENYYELWSKRYLQASIMDPATRQATMDALADEIERDLMLIGATAMEDRLQKYVPETIADLMDAGLLVWMLTGDKLETAVNIALTCNLIDEADEQIRLAAGSDVHAQLVGWASKLSTDMRYDEASNRLFLVPRADDEDLRAKQRPVMIIEGSALFNALLPENEQLFAETALRCRSVVCCRVSPKMKAQVVECIKKYRNGLTLAIGDGANDVTMLQAAHVGVGIAGLEGRQAMMASDYAFARFRYLRRLLLVHGRWSYMRAAKMTLFFFFKNFVFVFPLFWYQIFCGFSAQMIYHFSYQTFYNLLFTSLPIVAVGTFDQDLGDDFCLQYPAAYSVGVRGIRFSRPLYWMTIADGLYQAACCFFIPIWIYGFSESAHNYAGYAADIYDLGFIVMSSVMLCVTLSLALQIRNWTWIIHVALWGSLLLFFLYHVFVGLARSSNFFTRDLFGIHQSTMATASYWFCIGVTTVTALLPQFVYRYVMWTLQPDDAELLREREVLKFEKPMLVPETTLAKFD